MDRQDSPLSITGDAITFLTFILLAALIILWLSQRASQTSLSELQALQARFESRCEELKTLHLRLKKYHAKNTAASAATTANANNPETISASNNNNQQQQLNKLQATLQLAEFNLTTAADLIERRPKQRKRVEVLTFRNRDLYALQKQEVEENTAILERSLQELRDAASDIFGGVPSDTDFRVMELLAVVNGMRERLGDAQYVLGEVLDRVKTLEGVSP